MSASPRLFVTMAATAAAALLAFSPGQSRAQYKNDFDYGFHDVSDYQYFEPVDLDLDRKPVRYTSGFYFKYDKMYYNVEGERHSVGDPTELVYSEIINPGNNRNASAILRGEIEPSPTFNFNESNFQPSNTDRRIDPNGDGDTSDSVVPFENAEEGGRVVVPPQPYRIQNGISDAPPRAEFGWGDRYEMGYVDDDGSGVSLAIFDGNEVKSEQIYGFPAASPFAADAEPGVSNTPFGFGSVHVNFRTQSDFLLVGWRNYGETQILIPIGDFDPGGQMVVDDDDGLELADFPAGTGETLDGPGDELDGIPDEEDTGVNIDDVLQNGGTFFFIDVNENGEFDPESDVFFVDYGDLHEFNIRFQFLAVRNVSRVDGIELMRTHTLDNHHFMQKYQNHHLEVGWGVRFMRLDDVFEFNGDSDVLGTTFSVTQAENQIIGPQLKANWNVQKGPIRLGIGSRLMFGYNIHDINQTNGIGEDLAPGAVNRPLLLQPTYSTYGRQENTFSPVVELRAELQYQLTRSIALTAGYNAMFIDNVSRASQMVDYLLPDMGLLDGGNQDVFVNGATFGVEIWH